MRAARRALGAALVVVCGAALGACADEGSILTLELESIEARACDCGAESSMSIDAFFQVRNAGTEAGTVEPVEILLHNAADGMLLSRYGTVTAALELDDGGIPPIFDGNVPADTSLRIRFVVRSAGPVPGGISTLQLTATVSARVNGVARNYDSDGPIRLFYRTM